MRRLGLMGGTFDPIHQGHLDLARASADALHLDEVRLTPSHVPPHRGAPHASAFHRFAMTSLAAVDDARLVAWDEELMRGGASYTADTLRDLHQKGWPATRLFFLTGADAFAEIATWRAYPALLNLAHFIVCSRPGRPSGLVRGLLPELADRMIDAPTARTTADMAAALDAAPRIVLLDAATTAVSSTEVRARAAAGASLDGMVVPAVAAHIRKYGLYNSSHLGSTD